jgi:unsaturated rhamnogalacturonyl hydrolase
MNWPAGSSPQEIARRLVQNYLNRSLSLSAEMHYAEVCTWYGSLTSTKLIPDTALDTMLINRFAPLLTTAGADAIPSRAHVDDRIFGIVPLEIYLHNSSMQHLTFGKDFADKQWMTTTADGITTEARYWVDDMYMIPALQVQAYRATNDVKYLDRAALTVAAYIDELQQPNGLFFHTETSPRYWGRGNGWFAAGFTEMLRALPPTHARYAKILDGYKKMMAGLLMYQQSNGMWRQLINVDSTQNWAETSCTAMFTFAFVTGVKNGWLPADTYGPAARKAWLQMITYLDNSANVREVCVGTGEAATSGGGTTESSQNAYYLARQRSTGDFHGQAPYLWSASALMR